MFDATLMSPENFEGEWVSVVKRPVIVTAIQMNLPEGFTVTTKEGLMTGRPGDYLMIGVDGEKYPCAKEIFEKTYSVVAKNDRIRQVSAMGLQALLQGICKGLLSLLPDSGSASIIVGENVKDERFTTSVVMPKGNTYADLEQAGRHLVQTTQDVLNKINSNPALKAAEAKAKLTKAVQTVTPANPTPEAAEPKDEPKDAPKE